MRVNLVQKSARHLEMTRARQMRVDTRDLAEAHLPTGPPLQVLNRWSSFVSSNLRSVPICNGIVTKWENVNGDIVMTLSSSALSDLTAVNK